ncbi:alpha/beta-hydrolase [Pleurotus eryngii]|uniref:Alpha/beta-hydrolase n=1 Tax=Pleurotus eryngii TaxID=5323 RepID=A0A9P5ZRL9_PLEER|nr:alpha/beta-hydrolase [Pleurotus eryngii]
MLIVTKQLSVLGAIATAAQSAALPALTSPLGPVVNLGYAAFVRNDTVPSGQPRSTATFFGNIPHAQPPVGNLQFRAPRLLDETMDPTRVPISDARNSQVGIGSESSWTLSRNFLAICIIGVSVAYRLNLHGFLGGAAVAADGDLNAGLRDQRAALEWVQRHIHRIASESAGGASVVMQIAAFNGTAHEFCSNPSSPITQLIGFGQLQLQSKIITPFYVENVSSTIGCTGQNVVQCLRSASIGAIVRAINHNTRLIASGKFNNIEFIGCHCTNDGRTFVGGTPEQFNTEDDIRRLLFARWPRVTTATSSYPAPDSLASLFKTQYDRASQMSQVIVFSCMWNSLHAALFERAPFQGVMYTSTSDLYFPFDASIPSTRNHSGWLIIVAQSEARLSQEAIGFWTSFIVSDNLEAPARITWLPFASSSPSNSTRPQTAHSCVVSERGDDDSGTNTKTIIESISGEDIERCNFWMNANVTAETRLSLSWTSNI